MIGLKASTIRSEIIGVNSSHFVSGRRDFAKADARWGDISEWNGDKKQLIEERRLIRGFSKIAERIGISIAIRENQNSPENGRLR